MIRVIGCGNPLCADDGVGVAAVRLLEAEGVPEGVQVIAAGTPGLGLLDLLEGCRRAVLVDGVVSGAPPGRLHRFGPGDLPARELMPLSLHGINLVDALLLGRMVAPEKVPEELVILGLEIEDRTPYREGLSPAVATALPALTAAVRAELVRWQ